MIPAGYMAKRVAKRTDWLKANQVEDIYSVSDCVSGRFSSNDNDWGHNGFWLFDSPGVIRSLAREHSIDLGGTKLFYYEAYEMEFDGARWTPCYTELFYPTDVLPPLSKKLEGFDVVTFFAGSSPECSPLSCNGLASELPTNAHCLFATFEEAEAALSRGAFENSEPGPYRIFAVYSEEWE